MLIITFMMMILLEEPQLKILSVDEVDGRRLLSASISKNYALINLIRDGLPPVIELYHFDFNSGNFLQIKDGRIPDRRSYFICRTSEGFALVSRSFFKANTITFLSNEGQFQKSDRLDDYQGFSNKLSILFIGTYRDQQLLVTFQDADYPTSTVFLGVLHLKQKRLERVFQFESDESVPPPWVVSDKTHLYLVNTYTESVRLLDTQTFAQGKELLAAKEPILIEDKKKLPSSLGKTPSFLSLKPMLQSPLDGGDRVIISRTAYREGYHEVSFFGIKKKVQNSDRTFINLSGGNLTENTTVDLVSPGYGMLRFNKEEGVFVFLKDF